MKCPKCGKEIKEGSLFCEYCFADIRIVPTYDASVEASIQETMKNIQKEVGRVEERAAKIEKREKEIRRSKRIVVAVMCIFLAAGLLGAGGIAYLRYRQVTSVSHFVGMAYQAAQDQHYADAVMDIDNAIALGSGDIRSLNLLKAEYLQGDGRLSDAVNLCRSIILDPEAGADTMMAAYSRLINIYASQGDYATIATILETCENPDVQQSFFEYMLYKPTFVQKPGKYKGKIDLSIVTIGNGSIFYTLDGTTPTTDSLLYQKPIALMDGEYEVTAVYINHFGLASEPVRGTYIVASEKPDAPVVTPKSGVFSSQKSIEVEKPEEGSVYYTTDGSDPTRESKKYTEPISIPIGENTYKFVVIGDDDIPSDVIERTYTYNYSDKKQKKSDVSFGAEAGPNFIYTALFNHGSAIDGSGTLLGGTAVFSYGYIDSREDGDTIYYRYAESLVDAEGNVAATGRVFQVNALTGAVYITDENGSLVPY